MKKSAKTTPNLALRRAREQRGWSQEDVAREVGTDAFTISRWERGATSPGPHFRQKLSSLFGLSLAELGLVSEEVQKRPEGEAKRADETQIALAPEQAPILDSTIPPPLTQARRLVGRDALLDIFKQTLLSEKPGVFLALSGLPGVGKTALATALAHDEDVRFHFPDGILWAGLGYEPDILALLSHWGTLLHCAPPDGARRSQPQAWAASIHAAIGQRRMLLVIDDAWEVSEALTFQVGGANCAHVVTTRFPEIARRFAPASSFTVRELEEGDGRKLLMRLAPEIVQAEPEAAQALVTAVGGLPLALTLLGNFLRAQAHSGQPRRLRAALERVLKTNERMRLDEPQPLIGGHPSLPTGTPLSLQTIIGISDQQVSAEARAALRMLSVFPPKPNTFTEEAALAVIALTVVTLDELMDAGLLESGAPERYTMHQTIADYAYTQRTDAEEKSAAQHLIAYFVAYVEEHNADYTALERESNNILAALEEAFERQMLASLARGVHAFIPMLIARGLYTVAEVQLQRAREAAQILGDDGSQVTAWLHLGKIAEQRGNYAQAQEHWQNGLSLAREKQYRSGMAQMLQELSGLAWTQGQLPKAHQFLSEARAILQQLGDQRGLADMLNVLGNLAADQGQPEQARLLYEEALEAFQSLGERRGVAMTRHNLGILARERGQPEQARLLYQEALSILREIGDLRSSSYVLSNLGNLARSQGQLEQARQFLEEALAIHRRLENRRGLAFALLNLGNIAIEQKQFEQAHLLLSEALHSFQELEARRDSALTLQALGIMAREQRRFELAQQYLTEALLLFNNLQNQRHVALTKREMSILASEQGNAELAHKLLNEALTILVQLEDRREIAVTHQLLAALARQQGRLEEAQCLLAEALSTARQIGDRGILAHILRELGLLMVQQQQFEAALQQLLRADAGLSIVHAPDISEVEEAIRQISTQMSKSAFSATVASVVEEGPEQVYHLSQTEWTDIVRKLAACAQVSPATSSTNTGIDKRR